MSEANPNLTAAKLRLFGAPVCSGPAGEVPLTSERLGQLAVVLAARADWTHREQLAALLWPDLKADSGRRNLRKLLFRANQAPWFAGLEVRADAVRWLAGTDLRDFERACGEHDWGTAIDIYRGAFSDGFERDATAPFAEWLRFERHRLAALFRTAAAQRLLQRAGDATAREAVAQRWLALDPYDEDALAAVVEATTAQALPGGARRAVGDFVQRLERELGVAPSARVRALAASMDPEVVPVPARSPPQPQPPASTDAGLVGRRAEMLELNALAARAECRVLAITGPGGIGKSRLARAALATLAPQFDAVHWIALEDLAETAQVAPRVAAAFGVTLAGSGDPIAQVVRALQDRRVLLVLDNAEHLPGIAALVERLSVSCVGLKLLLTSRARPAIAGEWLFPLAGLPVPDVDETESHVQRTFDAVRLFELRARAVSPGFDAVRATGEVAALVRLLEGAPLAIELAAAWTRLLPVAEIRREIERSLDVLEGAVHGTDRHRSVRASFEHSWRLLTPVEQRCLGALSMFAAPFTREAAAQVAGAPLPVLAALADKSLLRTQDDGRFSFHALMRQCAREKAADDADTRRRYVDFHVQQLASFGDLVHGARRESIDAIEVALEDYRVVWSTALAQRAAAAVEVMAAPLHRFFEIKGRWDEAIELFDAALAQLDRAHRDSRAASAAVLRVLAALHYRKGSPDAAETAARQALPLYRSLKRFTGVRQCLQVIGLALWQRGDVLRARRYFEEGLRIAERIGDEIGTAAPLNGVAMCEKSSGRYDRALTLYERALALYRRAGGAQGQAITLNNLGNVLRMQQQWDGAHRSFAEALALCEQHGLAMARISCLVNLAYVDIALGRLDSAQTYLDRALDADARSGEGQILAEVRLGHGRIAALRGDFARARQWLLDGLQRGIALSDVPIQLTAIYCFGELAALDGQPRRAAFLWSFVARHAQAEHGDREESRRRSDQLALSADDRSAADDEAAASSLDQLVEALRRES